MLLPCPLVNFVDSMTGIFVDSMTGISGFDSGSFESVSVLSVVGSFVSVFNPDCSSCSCWLRIRFKLFVDNENWLDSLAFGSVVTHGD